MSIEINDAIFNVWEENYLQGSAAKRRCIIQDFKRELGLRKDYQGREILEMIQNADDQRSSEFIINLVKEHDDYYLAFTNSGPNTRPFTKAGFQSIMRPDLSSKQLESGGYENDVPIGNKGLGFRSLLNWSSCIEIKSAGLHCIFSEKRAKDAWKTIREEIEKKRDEESSQENDWSDLLRDCESVMKAYGCTCPISILAVPEVKKINAEDSSNDGISGLGETTTIIVHFSKELLEPIKTQLKGFRANSLLFIQHLESITVNNQIDGYSFTYRVQNKKDVELGNDGKRILGDNCKISTCAIDYGDRQEDWTKFEFKDGSRELAIAWLAGGVVCEEDRVVHCYFPTQVRLELPCVLHGSFDVDSSRNRILASSSANRPNEELLEKAGRFLVRVAEYRASCDAKIGACSWDPYRMVYLGETKLIAPMHCLKDGIDSELERKPKIFPTVSGAYQAFDKTCCYSEKLAEFLIRDKELLLATSSQEDEKVSMACHLMPEFTKNGFLPNGDSCFECRAKQLAWNLTKTLKGVDLGQRFHDLLESFLDVKASISPDMDLQLACLPNEDGEIQSDTVYVHCGIDLINAKELLGIHYINGFLVQAYERDVADKKTWDAGRWLVKHLCGIAKCTSSDISSMKDRVCTITKSKKYRNADFFKCLIKSLFETYKKNPDMAAMGPDFNVLNCEGNIKPAHEVSLYDDEGRIGLASYFPEKIISEKWWLKFKLSEWCGFLEAGREEVTRFFIDSLGIRLYLPVRYSICEASTWGMWEPYLRQQLTYNGGSSECEPWNYTVNRLNGHCDETAYNRGMLIADEFIDELIGHPTLLKDLGPFLQLLYLDEACRSELLNSPVYNYFKGKLQSKSFKSSFLSYVLSTDSRLSLLRQYAVDEDCCADGTQLSKDSYWGKVPLDERRAFLCTLGASPRLSEMPVENLYDMLGGRVSSDGIQGFYKRIREALVHQRDMISDEDGRKRFEEKCQELAKERLPKLYARNLKTGEVELKERELIYYWDNDILSRKILSEKFKLEIGSRVGAASVQTFFAVEPLGHDHVTVDDSKKRVNEALTKSFRNYLEDRKAYLLALRCRTLDECKISVAVSQITDLKFEIVSCCSYSLKDTDSTIKMESGDLVQTSNSFIICSDAETLDQALRDARFCIAVSEMLCILFGLTGTEIASEFRNVIRTEERDLAIFRTSDLSAEEWGVAVNALGLDSCEKAFWKLVLNRDLSLADERSLARADSRPEKISGLVDKEPPTGIVLERRLSALRPQEVAVWLKWLNVCPKIIKGEAELQPLKERVGEWFEEQLRYFNKRYLGEFTHELHDVLLAAPIEERKGYALKIEEYSRNPPWYLSVVESLFNEVEFPDERRLFRAFTNAVKDKFKVELKPIDQGRQFRPDLRPGETYLELLQRLCPGKTVNILDAEKRSLAFFEGNEEEFEKALKDWLAKEGMAPHQTNGESYPAKPTEVSEHKIEVLKVFPHNLFKHDRRSNTGPIRFGKGVSYEANDRAQKERGLQAELLVWELLNKDKEKYGNLQAKSSLLNQTGTADDSCHYDIEYLTPEGEERFLEVKACDGYGFFMSHGEYEFATDVRNRGKYVLALVFGRRVLFCESPFDSGSSFPSFFKKRVDTYRFDYSKDARGTDLIAGAEVVE